MWGGFHEEMGFVQAVMRPAYLATLLRADPEVVFAMCYYSSLVQMLTWILSVSTAPKAIILPEHFKPLSER